MRNAAVLPPDVPFPSEPGRPRPGSFPSPGRAHEPSQGPRGYASAPLESDTQPHTISSVRGKGLQGKGLPSPASAALTCTQHRIPVPPVAGFERPVCYFTAAHFVFNSKNPFPASAFSVVPSAHTRSSVTVSLIMRHTRHPNTLRLPPRPATPPQPTNGQQEQQQ